MGLTANRPTSQFGGVSGPVVERYKWPVADNVHIYQGALVQMTGGFVYPAGTDNTADTHTYYTVGRAGAEADNTVVGHTAGAISVEVAEGAFLWANSAIQALANTDAPCICYAEDAQTVSKTNQSTTLAKAGVFLGIDPVTSMCIVQTLWVGNAL